MKPILLSLLLATPAFAGGWGADVNTGAGGPLVESVRADLAAIVKASPADRPSLIEAFAAKKGPEAIEAVKRFRNPELKPLFHALARNPEWQIRHRALHALEYYGDTTALPLAWRSLTDPNERMREKAILFCIKCWDPKALPDVKPADITNLIAREEQPQLRLLLEAFSRRVAGKLVPEKVSTEFVRTLEDGLMLTPFLDGMDKIGAAAPGYAAKPNPRQGGGSASALPPAPRWGWAILGQGSEEVQGVSLQPFANLRGDGRIYHTGLDVGACLDGAAYYAVAEGVVKFVHTGSDMGTLLAVEHHVGNGELVTAVYMHGGDTVFVKAGDKVTCGQLLATMGLSYSIENGGHFAHLHFGLYPGAFQPAHNYGYKQVSAGLADWHDPAKWLPDRMVATLPLVSDVPGLDAELAGLVAKEEWARAYVEARKGAGTSEAAQRLVKAIETGAGEVVRRAEVRRNGGYAKDALELLKRNAGRWNGVPKSEDIGATAKAWEKDAEFKKELAAEKEFLAADAKAAELAAKKAPKEEIRALWTPLETKFAGQKIGARIQAKLDLVK